MAIIEHDFLIPIDENATLLRYMSLEKFALMLEKKSLFFCRADKFSDPFECSTPKKEFEYRKFKAMKLTGSDENASDLRVQNFSVFFQRVKKSTVINCWQINTHESDGMWQLYLKTNEGIAIQSNFKRIKEAFLNTPVDIYSSKVRYIDYENDIWYNAVDYPVKVLNTITSVIHKRIEFKHENEFRLFFEIPESTSDFTGKYWDNQENRIGKLIPINLNSLVEKIIFAPTVDETGKNLIREIVNKSGCGFVFQDSSLTRKPNY
ncbi:MAG: DUF2971 domain-containing protein [Candidatus Methanofastidiosum sp.]|jgi:hypothetical protein|nr:DUF2971 domain-containing protein [Methanofastidiosum sp.]